MLRLRHLLLLKLRLLLLLQLLLIQLRLMRLIRLLLLLLQVRLLLLVHLRLMGLLWRLSLEDGLIKGLNRLMLSLLVLLKLLRSLIVGQEGVVSI